ncbi:MAG: hypothetical protein ACTH0W_09210, partial [Microbacterium gubbeenense]
MAGVALAIVVATILLCLVVGVPIAVSLGAAGTIGALVVGGTDQFGGITFAMWNSVDNATFTSVPARTLGHERPRSHRAAHHRRG